MADVSVRPARPGDVADIGRVQLSTWQTAYASVVPARLLDGLTASEVGERWAEAVGDPPSGRHGVLVALEGGLVVGFAAVAPAADDDLDPASTGEVVALLVEPRWGRRGHGSRLLAAAVETLRGHGWTTAVAWVLESDAVSRGFYASAGWAPDGAPRTLDVDGRFVSEGRLHTSLVEAPAVPASPAGSPPGPAISGK